MRSPPASVKAPAALAFLTSVAPSHGAHRLSDPQKRAAIVSASAFCLFLTATCCSVEELIFILSFFFLVKYGQIREIFHVGYLAAWGPCPDSLWLPLSSPDVPDEMFPSFSWIYFTHPSGKEPTESVWKKGGGSLSQKQSWHWSLAPPTLLYTF